MNLKTLTIFTLALATFACVSAQSQFAVAAPGNTARLEKKPDFFSAFKPSTPHITNLTTSRRYATCANKPGVLQLGLGYGSTIGGGYVTVKDSFARYMEPGIGLTYNINFRFQYGVSEGISLGFYLRKDVGDYTTTNLKSQFKGFTVNGLSFGFEGKVYPINNEMFAVYIAPMVGVSFANSTIRDYQKAHSGKGVGLNYGITAGVNWYWTETLGMSFDIGYAATSMAGLFNNFEMAGMDYQIKYGGIYAGAGVVLKFDTAKY